MLTCHRGQRYEYVESETGLACFSVSQVRQVMDNPYMHANPVHLEEGRRRGNAVDRYFSFLLLSRIGCADAPMPVPGYEGYCESLRLWAETFKVEAMRVQESSLNRKLRVAGTPDAQVLYHAKKRMIALVDCKTGAPTKTDGIQLLLYKSFEGYTDCTLLLDVYAQEDGSIAQEAQRRPDPNAWAAALGAIAILHWRTR